MSLVSQTFRQPDIIEIARAEGKVRVEELAQRFGVTVQTIRRDLTELANSGRLTRVHGGAILPSGVANIIYEERRQLNQAGKRAIARACAKAIPDDASIFLNIGTTTEAVAQELLGHKNLMVVTNNINVAQILAANRSCDIILTGGTLRRADGGLTGALAVQTVENFRFDLAILGCSALSETGDMLDFDLQEIAVSRAALARAQASALVADHSKFSRHAPVRIGALDDIDRLYTDAPLPASLAAKCRDWGTAIEVSAQ
jgi:DeoR family glycerol-3-phosphate regulon repressor